MTTTNDPANNSPPVTVFNHIRARLLTRAGLIDQPPQPCPGKTLADLARTEWSHRFERLMRNRLVIGAMRYGLLHAPGKKRWDRVAGMQKRLRQYQDTGNLEYLVDVANLALLEFEEGQHPNKHFGAAQDGDHSCM